MSANLLRTRPRLRRLVVNGAQRVLAAADDPPAAGANELEGATDEPNRSSDEPADFARNFGPGWLAIEESRVTQLLYARLGAQDIAEIESEITANPDLTANYGAAPDRLARQQMVLAYGVWLGQAAATAKTGLSAAQPPEDVHLMARGPLAAAGGLYEADFVIDALISAGVEITAVSAALDFGCSSGRVLRVLAAAYPEIAWHGCDPNKTAIEWAGANLPDIEFAVSADAPPLAHADASLDLAYAISIWSHFEPALGLRWFEEMHRLIRPGGHLVCTTHGWTSVAHYATGEMRTPEQSREIADALYRQGWWYAPEFGEEGDWGVVNDDWGTAFLTPEWMLTQLCPQWKVLEFAPGRNQQNQDVFVLQRA
jgi:SAM-dependent methyltransferase